MAENTTPKKKRKERLLPRRVAALVNATLEIAKHEIRTPVQLQHRPEHRGQHSAHSSPGDHNFAEAGGDRLAQEIDSSQGPAGAARSDLGSKPGRRVESKVATPGNTSLSKARDQELTVAQRRAERNKYWKARFEALGLPIRKLRSSGTRSPILPLPLSGAHSPTPTSVSLSRFESRRERALALRNRMAGFSIIYNAAWHVRNSQHGDKERRDLNAKRFAAVLERELENCKDPEALIFAVADSLTSFNSELPWEGGR